MESLPPDKIGRVADVFEISSGLSSNAWAAVRASYRLAGGRGPLTALYNSLRRHSDFSSTGPLMCLLARDLERTELGKHNPLVVAHPMLASFLKERAFLFYQHGEIVAPSESLVPGVQSILVPLSETADAFLAAGVPEQSVVVTGLCIEPGLVEIAEAAFEARLERLSNHDPMCGAFFSSGAEPRRHVELLASAAVAACLAGGRAQLFARRNGRLARIASAKFRAAGIELQVLTEPLDNERPLPGAVLFCYDSRPHLNQLTENRFNDFDYFVAPAHERSSWAIGLGLPMFVVDQPIGSYAPLNSAFVLNRGVAKTLRGREDAEGFGQTLARLRTTGRLQQMAEAGRGKFDVNGFWFIAEYLSRTLQG